MMGNPMKSFQKFSNYNLIQTNSYSQLYKIFESVPMTSVQSLKILEKSIPVFSSYNKLFDTIMKSDSYLNYTPSILASAYKISHINRSLQNSGFSNMLKIIENPALKAFRSDKDISELIKSNYTYTPSMISSMLNSSMFHAHDYLKLGKEISRIFQSTSVISRVFENQNFSVGQIQKLSKAFSSLNWELFKEAAEKLEFTEQESVSIDSTNITTSEIQQLANEIGHDISLAMHDQNNNLEMILNAISSLQTSISSLQNTTREKIVTLLFLPVFISLFMSVINPISDYYVKEFLGSNSKKTENNLKAKLKETLDAATLKSYRIVVKNGLTIKLKPFAKSKTLGIVNFGQPVLFLERKKDWTLILWRDEEDSVIQGWVFSRYLRKIN